MNINTSLSGDRGVVGVLGEESAGLPAMPLPYTPLFMEDCCSSPSVDFSCLS